MADEAGLARVLLDAPITFRVGDELTHAPMFHATIRGVETKLILDTGSTDHILTTELAGQIGLEPRPGEAGTDSIGASVPSWTLGDVPIQVVDQELVLRNVIAISGPEPFEGWGIGGFVSPQHLHPVAWIVLDLAAERLIVVEANKTDVAAWLSLRTPSLQLISLRREAGDPTILVSAAIDPFDPVVTMLDSGGKGTEASASAVPGLAGGPPHSTGKGVSEGEAFGSAVADQTLMVGEARVPVPHLILRDQMEGRGGLVGMDVLRGTVLTVSADPARPVIWQVPAAGGSAPDDAPAE
jgi:hypothetical protein